MLSACPSTQEGDNFATLGKTRGDGASFFPTPSLPRPQLFRPAFPDRSPFDKKPESGRVPERRVLCAFGAELTRSVGFLH